MSCSTPGCVRPVGHEPPCIGDDLEAIDLNRPAGDHPQILPTGVLVPDACSPPENDDASPLYGAGSWEVLSDQGWVPWIPGVPFHGSTGEEVSFTLRLPAAEFPMKAYFSSATTGTQTNLQTMKQRQLRRACEEFQVKDDSTIKLQPPPLPANFEELASRPVTPHDFVAPINDKKAILALLVDVMAVCFVSGKWLMQQLDGPQDQPLARRQDLPAASFVPLQTVVDQTWPKTEERGVMKEPPPVPLVAYSYGWIRQGHPDPHRWHLQFVVNVLGAFMTMLRAVDVALFWDFFSIEQAWGANFKFIGRTPEENRRFVAALHYMHVIYGHQHIFVWRNNSLPPEALPLVEERGWPHFEKAVFTSSYKPTLYCRGLIVFVFEDTDVRLLKRSCDVGNKIARIQNCSYKCESLCVPDEFRKQLLTMKFTGNGDHKIVGDLYGDLFSRCLSQAEVFSFANKLCTVTSMYQIGNALQHFDHLRIVDVATLTCKEAEARSLDGDDHVSALLEGMGSGLEFPKVENIIVDDSLRDESLRDGEACHLRDGKGRIGMGRGKLFFKGSKDKIQRLISLFRRFPMEAAVSTQAGVLEDVTLRRLLELAQGQL